MLYVSWVTGLVKVDISLTFKHSAQRFLWHLHEPVKIFCNHLAGLRDPNLDEWGCPLNNDPKLAMAQPSDRWTSQRFRNVFNFYFI